MLKFPEGGLERRPALGFRAFGGRGISYLPMLGFRLARPHRAGLGCGLVADRDDEIDRLRVLELVLALAATAREFDAVGAQRLERERIDDHGRMAAGAEAQVAVTAPDETAMLPP